MDWIRFFEDHRVEYVSRGPNTKKGNINIHCPWCGDDDPSHHMGVSLNDERFGCWRSKTHAGKRAQYLVQAVLGCSMHQAKLIAQQYSKPDPESLDEAIAALNEADVVADSAPNEKRLRLPADFYKIKPSGTTAPYYTYLKSRGFTDPYEVSKQYNLRAAVLGRFRGRLIFPIYQNHKIVNWTGRAIGKTIDAPRYLTLSEDEGAIKNNKDTIYNEGLCTGGKLLFIVEGPIDTVKLDYYGDRYGANACGVYGTNMSIEQICILAELCKLYKRTVLLMDPEAIEASFTNSDWLSSYNVKVGRLDDGIEDPGAMTKEQVVTLIKRELSDS